MRLGPLALTLAVLCGVSSSLSPPRPTFHASHSLIIPQVSSSAMMQLSARRLSPNFPRHLLLPFRSHGGGLGRRSALFSSASDLSEVDWTTDRVRSTFVDYFEKQHKHTMQPSSPVVPLLDPTLLFANAGMNQFKPIFLGQVDPSSPLAKLSRAVNSQKCIRAGGKHNDLEDVGRDTYHHTFFEMLGTWSFGDYFKKEAVDWAWDLLTNVYKIDQDRLYATYFGGDEKLGLPADEEARDFWLKYLPAERVLSCDAKDNFWEMGDTGPCGPCSEIHYDRIGGRDAAALVNADDPDVIEIWNIVFIQYNRDESGLKQLPNKHIDTGMGLERLASLLQDKSSNYDIDVFQPLFSAINKSSKMGPYTGLVGDADTDLKDTAYRAIADHVRALSFAIADGAVPSNEGRGYVLRRILRRGVRYGIQILKADRGFFAELVPVVIKTFGGAYPELVAKEKEIYEILVEEEQAFGDMLDRGIKYFDELKSEDGRTSVSGEESFFMYDTLGFPIDLTELMAEEAKLTVDLDGFEACMEEQKKRSRMARQMQKAGGEARILELIAEQTSWLSSQSIVPTDDSAKYHTEGTTDGVVVAIYDGSDDDTFGFQQSAGDGDRVGVILDRTSFYAESGGQESDTGVLKIGDATLVVSDCQVFGGYVLHIGTIEGGNIAVGASSVSSVDYERRKNLVPNHTMTHVLNHALREVLDDDVDQRGSLVSFDKLRFDFTAKKGLNAKQLSSVEDKVNDVISKKLEVYDRVVPLEDAKSISGVRAVFGEFYPDPVRVISVGSNIEEMLANPKNDEWVESSVEFCGGTHLTNTAEAEDFVVVEETAVAKGIRRIVAVTRGVAAQCRVDGAELEQRVTTCESLNVGEDLEKMDADAGGIRKDLDSSYISAPLKTKLRARLEGLQKKIVETKKANAGQKLNKVLTIVREEVVGKSVCVMRFNGIEAKGAQKIAETAKKANPDCCVFGIIEPEVGETKIMAFTSVPEGKTESLGADKWLKDVLGKFGGRGGGKAGFAQGQCDGVDLDQLVREAEATGGVCV